MSEEEIMNTIYYVRDWKMGDSFRGSLTRDVTGHFRPNDLRRVVEYRGSFQGESLVIVLLSDKLEITSSKGSLAFNRDDMRSKALVAYLQGYNLKQ